MSLKSKFKTDAGAANSGVWFDFPEQPNKDGSIPGFKLARKSGQNKHYARAMRDFNKAHVDDNGVLNTDDMTEGEAEVIEVNVFVGSLLTNWRNFQPNDDNNSLKFSEADARKIFSNPNWIDLMNDLSVKCGQMAAYKVVKDAKDTKN